MNTDRASDCSFFLSGLLDNFEWFVASYQLNRETYPTSRPPGLTDTQRGLVSHTWTTKPRNDIQKNPENLFQRWGFCLVFYVYRVELGVRSGLRNTFHRGRSLNCLLLLPHRYRTVASCIEKAENLLDFPVTTASSPLERQCLLD